MTSLAEFFWQGILQVHANQNQVDATDDHEPEGVSDAELLVLQSQVCDPVHSEIVNQGEGTINHRQSRQEPANSHFLPVLGGISNKELLNE